MKSYHVLRLTDRPELKDRLADWFHSKWKIPKEAYLESMEAGLQGVAPVPQWYCVLDGGAVIAGLGVIANDFHDRKALTPNVCAVYVEERFRHQGIARSMLDFVCRDMADKGIRTLYLITDHTSLYERYGWRFLCMVQGDGETMMSRMYIHEMP